MLRIIIGILISYLIGSIPTAYIFGRLLKGIDIRKFGSGNVGATNALRVLGSRIGILVLILDILKGALTVVFIADFVTSYPTLIAADMLRFILGLVCVAGHNWTIFLNFKGGKGVATTFGVLLGLSLRVAGFGIILGIIALVWFTTFLLTKIVSISSVLSGIALPLLMFLFRYSKGLVFFGFLAAALITLRHLPNLKRLFQGKEPRLSFKTSPKT